MFHCLWCGYAANADQNAAQNIAERFGDDQLNALSFREVETVLALQFMRRLELELQPILGLPRGKVVGDWAKPDSQPLLTVNQPGQDPYHSCLQYG
jgi:transposase